MSFKYDWITSWETIYSEAFQKQWLDWHNHSEDSHVFSHPALGMTWMETYRPIRYIEPLFCIAKKGYTTIFMPFIRWKRNWKNAFKQIIVPLGYSDFDYHDPIITGNRTGFNAQDSAYFWSELIPEINARYKYDKILINGIHLPDIEKTLASWTEDEHCPYISLDQFSSFGAYKESLPKKIVKEINRREKRMNENGKVTFHHFGSSDIDKALNEIPEMLLVHHKRWPNAYKAAGFHLNMIKLGIEAGIVHFSVLRFNNETISWRLGFIDKGIYYSYMPTFKESWGTYNPGKLHLLYCISQAFDANCYRYDFLRGAEDYKTNWSSDFSVLCKMEIENKALFSRVRNRLVGLKNILSVVKSQ